MREAGAASAVSLSRKFHDHFPTKACKETYIKKGLASIRVFQVSSAVSSKDVQFFLPSGWLELSAGGSNQIRESNKAKFKKRKKKEKKKKKLYKSTSPTRWVSAAKPRSTSFF